MTKLELEIFDDVISTLNKIRNINDAGIDLQIPEGSILFENVLNLKLIKKRAEKYSQTVHFSTTDPVGQSLIDMIEEGGERFIAPDEMPVMNASNKVARTTINLSALAPVALWLKPFLHFRLNSVRAVMIPILIALILVLSFGFASTNREANVKLTINSQPLTKSVTVKVKAGAASNAQAKILAGINLQNSMELSKEGDTTGEKTVGEKAKGTAKIFNKTDTDKTFKKGQILVFSQSSKDYNFVLNDQVDIPARTEDAVTHVITPGSAEIDVTASVVGAQYNIDKDEPLEVYNYKKAEFSAVAQTDFTGGKSETKKIVAQTDLDKLSAALTTDMNTQAGDSLKGKVASSQTLIDGSTKVTPIKEEPNHKVGDEADKVSITKTATVEGLVYQKTELDRLLDEMLKEFIPDGFVLSTKDRETNVAVLGNSSNSVLSSTEADIQVTIKSFVVPNISEEDIKKQLAGKSSQDAQKILQNVRNIETFSLNVDKGLIPVFNTVPKDLNKINVEIVKK